jgi:hypothetical protein
MVTQHMDSAKVVSYSAVLLLWLVLVVGGLVQLVN